MTISLYRINEDPRRLEKSPESIVESITGYPRDDCSVIRPKITLEGDRDDLQKIIVNCNYVWIQEFRRWYFIENITLTSAYNLEIDLKVDVLYTYKSDIYHLGGILERSEAYYNERLKDNEYPVQANRFINTVTLDAYEAPTPAVVIVTSAHLDTEE